MQAASPYFVAILPGPELHEQVQAAKTIVAAVAGKQLYVTDPPHLTVFLSLFQDRTELVQRCQSLQARLKVPDLEIEGWSVFERDCLTGNNTLVCKINSDVQAKLRSLQQQVLNELSPLRDPIASTARYRPSWNNLSSERQTAVEQYGFPFVGSDWCPHVTIASISQAAWPVCWQSLEPKPIVGNFGGSHLALFELIEKEPHRLL